MRTRHAPPATLQALRSLQDQLRSAYGDRWTLALSTPDFVVVALHPTDETPPDRPAAGSSWRNIEEAGEKQATESIEDDQGEIMSTTTKYRVSFVYDQDARFEECNGKPRPLTEQEYAENQYRGCPDHPRSKVPPARSENGRGWCGECGKEYADIPYAEYLAYYGNPRMHRYIGTIVETQEGIKDWAIAASLWGSDFMRDDPALKAVHVGREGTCDRHYYTPEEARALPGYFEDLAKELLEEAGAR